MRRRLRRLVFTEVTRMQGNVKLMKVCYMLWKGRRPSLFRERQDDACHSRQPANIEMPIHRAV